jgi:hypothetical protein
MFVFCVLMASLYIHLFIFINNKRGFRKFISKNISHDDRLQN